MRYIKLNGGLSCFFYGTWCYHLLIGGWYKGVVYIIQASKSGADLTSKHDGCSTTINHQYLGDFGRNKKHILILQFSTLEIGTWQQTAKTGSKMIHSKKTTMVMDCITQCVLPDNFKETIILSSQEYEFPVDFLWNQVYEVHRPTIRNYKGYLPTIWRLDLNGNLAININGGNYDHKP